MIFSREEAPELALWRAVLLAALKDIEFGGRIVSRNARRWATSYSRDLELVCLYAGVDMNTFITIAMIIIIELDHGKIAELDPALPCLTLCEPDVHRLRPTICSYAGEIYIAWLQIRHKIDRTQAFLFDHMKYCLLLQNYQTGTAQLYVLYRIARNYFVQTSHRRKKQKINYTLNNKKSKKSQIYKNGEDEH